MASCDQLEELEPGREGGDYVLPEGGLREGLQGRMVLL